MPYKFMDMSCNASASASRMLSPLLLSRAGPAQPHSITATILSTTMMRSYVNPMNLRGLYCFGCSYYTSAVKGNLPLQCRCAAARASVTGLYGVREASG
jgi:hypothetical protein